MVLLTASLSLVLAGLPMERVDAHGFLGKLTVGLAADDASPIDARLAWLEERGLDGVGFERRLSEVESLKTLEQARQVRVAAEAHGRVFHVVYDVRGAEQARWAALLRWDWEHVVDGQLRATSSEAWVREDGRPVVALRGLGAVDGPGTVAETMDLIDWLKDRGCYVVAIVPAGWRTGQGTRPNFLSAFARVDAVQVEAGAGDTVHADAELATQLGLALQLAVPMDAPVPATDDAVAPRPELRLTVASAFLDPADRARFPALFGREER